MKSFAGGNFLKKIFPDFEPIFPEAIKKYSDFKHIYKQMKCLKGTT